MVYSFRVCGFHQSSHGSEKTSKTSTDEETVEAVNDSNFLCHTKILLIRIKSKRDFRIIR
jgi:hypothetical protein